MKRISDTLSGASEALTDEVYPEQYDKSAEAEDRPCGGDTLYKSLWVAGRYALQLAAADAGVPYQAAGRRTFGVDEGGFSAGRCSYFCGCLWDRGALHRTICAGQISGPCGGLCG